MEEVCFRGEKKKRDLVGGGKRVVGVCLGGRGAKEKNHSLLGGGWGGGVVEWGGGVWWGCGVLGGVGVGLGVDAEGVVGAAGREFAQENHFVPHFAGADVEIVDAFVFRPVR